MSIGLQASDGNPSAAAQPVAPKLPVKVGGQKHKLNVANLSDETITSELAAEIANAEHAAVVNLDKLLSYSDADRWAVLGFFGRPEQCRVSRCWQHPQQFAGRSCLSV